MIGAVSRCNARREPKRNGRPGMGLAARLAETQFEGLGCQACFPMDPDGQRVGQSRPVPLGDLNPCCPVGSYAFLRV